MEGKKNSHKFVVRKPEGRSLLGETILKWMLNRMNGREVDLSNVVANLRMNGAISPWPHGVQSRFILP
jgi:hypothetical protein